MIGLLAFLGFLTTIPAANWMIGHVGACSLAGPCTIPVGFGLRAPSGVLMIGAALVLRDIVHARLGWGPAAIAILLGAIISLVISPPSLVLASVAAILLSEFTDLAVYAPLARRRLVLAVLLSGVVGAAVDSLVFLWIAFGSLEFLAGQIVGKVLASAFAAAVLVLATNWQRWDVPHQR